MSTLSYKCPCCASPLTYNGATNKLECDACGNHFTVEDMEAFGADQIDFAVEADSYSAGDHMDEFHCKSCGAQLICESTTTATECPYCGSPTILAEHVQGGVKPEKVVPFLITKEQAESAFNGYFHGKRLLPNIFKSNNHIAEMRKLYVPYWLFDCGAKGDFIYDAEKVHTRTEGDWKITETEHYAVRRAGTMQFEHIPVDGSAKMDRAIAESLEPYDLSKAVPFQTAVLSGAMADHADITAEECEPIAAERVKHTAEDTLRSTVKGYDRVDIRKGGVRTEDGKASPVLMPVWLITTNKQTNKGPKTYTFAINGQSGELTCDVPADKGKYWTWLLSLFVILTAVACGALALLEMLETGTMAIAGIAALIIAFIVVSSMAAKLKTAANQYAAASYLVRDSLELSIKTDRYLNTTVTREKIERNEPEKKD